MPHAITITLRVLPLASSITLGKQLNLFLPQFPLKNGITIVSLNWVIMEIK